MPGKTSTLTGAADLLEGLKRDDGVPRHRYSPLKRQDQEIRALCLDDTQEPDRLISGCFEQLSLLEETSLDFDALSWVWGDPTNTTSILIEGKTLEIPRNAEVVLREVCLKRGIRRVWIDCCCIDSSNDSERNRQISLMRDIYSKAHCVHIWLGGFEADDYGNEKTAVKAIESLAALCRSRSESCDEKRLLSVFQTSAGTYRHHDMEFPDQCEWRDAISLDRYFDVPWFQRLWIVQEVVLARNAICHTTETQCRWEDVGLAAIWLRHDPRERSSSSGLLNAAQMFEMSFSRSSVSSLLYSSSLFRTTRSHDKIYGMLGLIDESIPAKAPTKLRTATTFSRPDYTKALHNVYTDATLTALQCDGNLFLLEVAQMFRVQTPATSDTRAEALQLPSWVPDYRYCFENATNLGLLQPIRPMVGRGASNGMETVFEEGAHEGLLRLQGVIVDEVAESAGIVTGNSWHEYDKTLTTANGRDDSGVIVPYARWTAEEALRAPRWSNMRELA